MTNKVLGIIAGEGKYPVLSAKGANEEGWQVVVACVKGNAYESDFKPYSKAVTTLKLGQFTKCVEFLKQNGVTHVIMAGRVKHISIFSLIPDMRMAKVLATLRDKRAESLLGAAISEFKKEGIEVLSSFSFLKNCTVKAGVLTKRAPNEDEKLNIDLGLKVAHTLASLDVGLTVVLSDKAVLAVEGMEGTDECIKRGGEIYKTAKSKEKHSLVIVKVARPKQDDRFDLPVIGKGTIKTMLKVGANILAVEAGKTVVLDVEEVIEIADKNNISIIAI